jgi:hypothetical protein
MTDMEEELERLRQQVADLMAEKENYNQYIDKLGFEKEEIIRTHTLETGDLRKRIGVLTNHVQSLEGAAMSTSTSQLPSQGFSGPNGPFGDMDGMTMVDGSWENMSGFLGDFPMDQSTPAQAPEVKQEMQIMSVAKKSDDGENKASIQGGLLTFFLLVGAYVLSHRQTPAIPRVPDDVRAASASLVQNVLKDAGVPAASGLESAIAPQPSGASGSWSQSSQPTPMTGLSGVAPSMLSELSDALTQPTQEQANEQLFGLTAAQYNGVQEFVPGPQRTQSQGRRNLAEALAAMQVGSKAEVYTRSLLWDQVPGDVVRTFARMVAEANGPSSAGAEASDTVDGR